MGLKKRLKSDLKTFTMHIRDTGQAFEDYQRALTMFNEGYSAKFVASAWYELQASIEGLKQFQHKLAAERPIEIWDPKASELIAGMTEIRLRKRK